MKHTTKTLSVIIPTYNMEQYLGRCLDSLLSEVSIPRLEVLVINDGSKDSSLEIARGYEARFPDTIRVIDKPNGNYGSCINRGLKEATGHYVKILDADDWFDTPALDELLLTLEGLDVDLVISDYMFVTADGNGRRKSFALTPGKVLPLSACSDMSTVGVIEMHAITYKRENLIAAGYVQSEGISYTDLEWSTIPMATVKTLYYFNKPVYNYLIEREGNTMSARFTKKWLDQVLVVRRAIVKAYVSEKFTDEVTRRRMFDIVSDRLYGLYSAALIDGRLDVPELRAFDEELKQTSPELYDSLWDRTVHRRLPYRFIRAWRVKGRVSPLFLALYKFIRKIKK